MPKQITSKKTKKEQIVSDETWAGIVAMGRGPLFCVFDIPEKKLPKPEELSKKVIKHEKTEDND